MADSVEPDPGDVGDVFDDVVAVLSDKRRRFVLHHLAVVETTIPLAELAERMAEWDGSDSRETRLVLVHRHLPKMENAGLIDADPDFESVRISAKGERANDVRTTCVERARAVCG